MSHSISELPAKFIERLQEIIPPDQQHKVLDTFVKSKSTSFRINPFRAPLRQEAIRSLRKKGIPIHPVPWYADAFWITEKFRDRLLAHELYASGGIYVQNLSSMIPPLVLNPQAGERILDLTAAPGSKTLQIAALMKEQVSPQTPFGQIVAVELVRPRFYRLLRNIKLQGVYGIQPLLYNGERFWRKAPESFDRVLLDTPCSTEGRFHVSNPETYKYWSERKIKEMTRKQKKLLYSAIQCLKPGGELVYSTCSFAPEENEAIITHALKKFGDAIEILPIELPLDNIQRPLKEWRGQVFPEAVQRALRILPTATMEGFFICHLRKTRHTLHESSR